MLYHAIRSLVFTCMWWIGDAVVGVLGSVGVAVIHSHVDDPDVVVMQVYVVTVCAGALFLV